MVWSALPSYCVWCLKVPTYQSLHRPVRSSIILRSALNRVNMRGAGRLYMPSSQQAGPRDDTSQAQALPVSSIIIFRRHHDASAKSRLTAYATFGRRSQRPSRRIAHTTHCRAETMDQPPVEQAQVRSDAAQESSRSLNRDGPMAQVGR